MLRQISQLLLKQQNFCQRKYCNTWTKFEHNLKDDNKTLTKATHYENKLIYPDRHRRRAENKGGGEDSIYANRGGGEGGCNRTKGNTIDPALVCIFLLHACYFKTSGIKTFIYPGDLRNFL